VTILCPFIPEYAAKYSFLYRQFPYHFGAGSFNVRHVKARDGLDLGSSSIILYKMLEELLENQG